ncbi:NAD(P) transhydrogenase subunit alpha [Thalassotalea fonticola]|uniref:proton-translocating NAD(P)(+) transhydrogenase n=1 Tax=Thalassotalea fonticola TaxID=3065649 RepID=A0ABZ0GJZ3_9GAMM|nr:NAD(P) transhydrogenase subunit alpha [Colwelliaceae bacterium S1-1]
MQIFAFPKEIITGEKRCALLPANVKAYKLSGARVLVESGLGESIHVSDEEYSAAGAEVITNRAELLTSAEVIISVHKLPLNELTLLKDSAKTLISFLDPFNDASYLQELQKNNITSISMEMLPRISRCQKMDALSSQASLAGYVMTMKAASKLPSILPMMMTPSGTLKPAKVFVIGAGVAGLQAIATAKRLGASVTAFDTRSVVAEQVQSLGGKFLEIDLGETGETSQGYAKALTTVQMEIQRQAQAKCIADSDIVITTAQLFGRKPPVLISEGTIALMKPGSVIVDMAAESGGNVQGSVAGEETVCHGVTVIGQGNWSNYVAKDASQMYANNIQHFISDIWCKENKALNIDLSGEVLSACVITHQGKIVSEMLLSLQKQAVA